MTKIADSRPPYCASCFQHKQEQFVDFEAAYDGPVIPGATVPVHVDDLIICESCLYEAFNLLDPLGLKKTIEDLTELAAQQQDEIDAKDKVITGFQASVNELIDNPVKRPPGRPRLEGLPEKVRAQINQRRVSGTKKEDSDG